MGKYDELVERLRKTKWFYNCEVRGLIPETAGSEAATAITTLEAELAAMKARGDRLAGFARHRKDCDYIKEKRGREWVTLDCSCGMTQALTEWRDQ